MRILIILYIVKALICLGGNESEAWLVRVIIRWSVIGCLLHSSQFHDKPFGKQYEGNIPEYPKQLLYCLDNTCCHGAEVWVCVSNALRPSHFHTHTHTPLSLGAVNSVFGSYGSVYTWCFLNQMICLFNLCVTLILLFPQTLICPPDAVHCRTLKFHSYQRQLNFTCSFDITVRCTM